MLKTIHKPGFQGGYKMSKISKPIIDSEICTGYTICIDNYPATCLDMKEDISIPARPEDCTECPCL